MHLVIMTGHARSAVEFGEAVCKRWLSTSHGGCAACPSRSDRSPSWHSNNQTNVDIREGCMPRSMSRFISISLVGLVGVAQTLAQGGATGAISGTVLDPSGAVVSGADVRIVNQDTGALTRTCHGREWFVHHDVAAGGDLHRERSQAPGLPKAVFPILRCE